MQIDPGLTNCPAELSPGPCEMQLFTDGYLYASAGMVVNARRIAATLLITLSDRDFELEVERQTERLAMVAIRPLVAHRLMARQVPFICLDIYPSHPHYRAFTGITGLGLQSIPRDRFAAMDDSLRAFHAGQLKGHESRRLYQRITNLAASFLPIAPPVDLRVQRVVTLLEANHELSTEELAQAVSLSRNRLSHLFSTELGVTLRLYIQALKTNKAGQFFGSGMSLTEIAAAAGFADSAHFSKVWSQAYGVSPIHFFFNKDIRFHAKGQQRVAIRSRNSGVGA